VAGYTRQTTFVDAATIEAADHNNELDQVEAAFSNTTGHAHDGTAAEGPVINVIGDAGNATPLNKVLVDTANDNVGIWVDVSGGSVEQVIVADGQFSPVTDSDVDLGTTSLRFKTLYVDDITVTDAATTRTNLGVDAAGTDNSTDVTIAAGKDYITISGQELTLGNVDLTTDVTGTLPVANGGTGGTTAAAARTALGVDAAGTDNSTDVTIAAGKDYITISGQELTLGNVDLTTDVTGALPVANGGTGATDGATALANLGNVDVTLTGSYDYLTLSGQEITVGQVDLTTDVTGVLPFANGGVPVHAYGVVRSGTLQSGSYGITSASVTSGGVIDVTLSSAVSSTSTASVIVSPLEDPSGFKDSIYLAQADFIDTTSVEVGTVLLSWSGTLTATYVTKDFVIYVIDS